MGGTASMPVSTASDQPAQPSQSQPSTASHNNSQQAAGNAPEAPPQGRIAVDVRGTNLQANNYSIYVKQQPVAVQNIELGVRSISNSLASIGGLVVTVLTVQKLVEEIRLMRMLRRHLGSLASSMTSSSPGLPGMGPTTQDPASTPGKDTRSPRRGGGWRRSALPGLEDCIPPATTPQSEAEAEAAHTSWDSISGLETVKRLLQEATVLPTLRPDLFTGIRAPPKGILLFGPPGTGKTLLARAVANESRAHFMAITGSSILSMWYGQSEANVKALFERARAMQPAVIFIDEVDSLLGRRSASDAGRDSTADRRVTNEFLAYLDGIQGAAGDTRDRVVVIAATNNPWDLDEAALSRFARRIFVPLPDKATRSTLLARAMHGVACSLKDEEWRVVAGKAENYSGRDLMQVCREAAMRPLRELWGSRLLESSYADITTNITGTSSSNARGSGSDNDTCTRTSSAGAAAQSGGAGGAAAAGGQGAPSASSGGQVPVQQRAVQAQLLNIVSRSLAQPRINHKKVRRELDAWRKRYKATWLDIDSIMDQAQRMATAQQQQQGKHAAPMSAADDTSLNMNGQAQALGEEVNGTRDRTDLPVTPPPPAEAETGKTGKEQAATAAASSDGVTGVGSPEQTLSAPAAVLGAAAAGLETVGSGALQQQGQEGDAAASLLAPAGADVYMPATDSSSPACTPAADMDVPVAATMAAAAADASHTAAAKDVAGTRACPTSLAASLKQQEEEACGTNLLQVAPIAADSTDTASAAGSAAAAAAAAGEGSPTQPATSDKHSSSSGIHSKAVGASRSSADAAPGSGKASCGKASSAKVPPVAWAVDDLLQLPASEVRAVSMADFDAALKQINASEFDMTSRYDEWNQRFGSGADSKHGAGKQQRWMAMYV